MIAAVCIAPVLAQEPDPSIKRISAALEKPQTVRLFAPDERLAPPSIGIFTLLPPSKRSEVIRLSIPIGELVTKPLKAAARANRRRQEADARERVAAALAWFTAQQR